ncbi:hypothetical protein cypCar_00022782, partial [Cyprinus carpio]
AIEDAKKAHQLQPGLVLAFLRIGIAEYHLHNFITAHEALTAGKELDCSIEGFQTWIQHCENEMATHIPNQTSDSDVRKQEWTAIIPNSQLIVIPYPQNDPRSWSAKLYLTPSNIVLLTAIALIGVCVFILVIIGILHWQEKKADDREKRQEAHRFHFDAM